MDRILENIRMVPGVIGTIVVDKTRALTFQLMPSSYTTEHVKSIALPLLHLSRSIDKNMSLDFFFENGLARLYNNKEQIVVILGHPELNLNSLGVVCREAIPAISRKLSRGQLGLSPTARQELTDAGPEFLIKAINIIAGNCVEKIGAYLVTKNLRKSRDELAKTYFILTNIIIDNNGIASFIKGTVSPSGKDNQVAFAHWANLFLSYCARSTDKLKPDDIMELTFEIKDRLDLSGFYQLYANIGT